MTKSNRKTVRTMIGLGVGLFCAMLMAPDQSRAASISFNFTGSVGDVFGGVFTPRGFGADGFTTSLPVSGGATINSLATDSNAASNIGRYNPIQDFSVSVGTYFATYAPGNSFVRVTNSAPGAGSDIYELRINGLLGDAVNGFKPTNFILELTDPTGTAFSSDALPAGAPSLSSFARSEFRLLFGAASTRVQGALTSLVPLPAAVWLFGAGLIALVGLGSRGLVTRKES
ncbi:MAG: hypothetical protein JSR62_12200 [Nitrospira sp.]|nr:hypothetical protein [Nitrospira sp.]